MWRREPHRIDPDVAPCGVLLFGDDGRLLAINDTLITMLGLEQERDRLGELQVDDLLAPAARVFHQMVLAPILKLKGRADEVHLILRTRTGADLHVLTCGVRRLEATGPVNHCTFMPINERKKLEGELVQTRRAAQQVPGAIFQLEMGADLQGRFLYLSDTIESLVGASAAALRQDASPFFDALHPEDRERFHQDIAQAGQEGRGGHYKFRIQQGDPPRTVWCETHATPRRLPDGKIIWNGYIADITRQKALEEKLRENDKLRLTSLLAAGIAHDFNNLLGSINGLTELCMLEAAAGSRQERNLQRILDSGQRAATLVRQMLAYARQAPRSVQPLSLGAFVQRVQPLLAVGLAPGVTLKVTVLADGVIDGDEVQLEQALLNLVNNASYAMRERGGEVAITVDLPPGGRSRQARPGVRLRVQDQGCGIAPEDLPNVYQPFYTTKPVGEGTGLGLSATHGIVSAHGGFIEAESRLGRGSTFTLWLPLRQPAEAAA